MPNKDNLLARALNPIPYGIYVPTHKISASYQVYKSEFHLYGQQKINNNNKTNQF